MSLSPYHILNWPYFSLSWSFKDWAPSPMWINGVNKRFNGQIGQSGLVLLIRSVLADLDLNQDQLILDSMLEAPESQNMQF